MATKTISILELIRKVIGAIEPAGDSSIDGTRFENLKEMTALIESLLQDLAFVSHNKISHEHSVKKAGEYANTFLKSIAEDFCNERLNLLEKFVEETSELSKIEYAAHQELVGIICKAECIKEGAV